jgi:hypothetical protein
MGTVGGEQIWRSQEEASSLNREWSRVGEGGDERQRLVVFRLAWGGRNRLERLAMASFTCNSTTWLTMGGLYLKEAELLAPLCVRVAVARAQVEVPPWIMLSSHCSR